MTFIRLNVYFMSTKFTSGMWRHYLKEEGKVLDDARGIFM